jgi:hypothetical protein
MTELANSPSVAQKRPRIPQHQRLHRPAHLPPAGAGLGLDPAPRQRRADVRAAAVHHLDVRHLGVLRDLVRPLPAAFNSGIGFVPGWFVKLVALA